MSHCIKCGTNLPEGSAFCPSCGSPVVQMSQNQAQGPAVSEEKLTLAAYAISLAVFIPPIGIILAIMGTLKYTNPAYKKICQIAIPTSVVCLFLMPILYLGTIFYSLGFR